MQSRKSGDISYRDPPCPGSWDLSSCTVTEPHQHGRSELPHEGLSLQTSHKEHSQFRAPKHLQGLEHTGLEAHSHTRHQACPPWGNYISSGQMPHWWLGQGPCLGWPTMLLVLHSAWPLVCKAPPTTPHQVRVHSVFRDGCSNLHELMLPSYVTFFKTQNSLFNIKLLKHKVLFTSKFLISLSMFRI